ncbi:MAG: translation initiation factor IF-2 [Deltaproteobacteria bacterium]|nr:translation initiation factor IF-2 [Deltaproteobacteria bacterium]
MGKRRIYEVAKDLGIESKDLLKKLQDIGVDVKSHSSTVDEDDIKRALAGPAPKKPETRRGPGMIVRKKADIVQPEPDQAAQDAQAAADDAQAFHDATASLRGPATSEPAHRDADASDAQTTHDEPEHRVEATARLVEHHPQVGERLEAPRVTQATQAPQQETQAVAEQQTQSDATQNAPEGTPPPQPRGTLPGSGATGSQAKPGDPAMPTAVTTGARVVRMIDRDKLVSRIPQRRPMGAPGGFRPSPGGPGGFRPSGPPGSRPSGPGGFRPGGPRPGPGMLEPQMPHPNRFGPVKELRVVSDMYGKGKEMVDVNKEKAGKKGPGGAAKPGDGKRERLDKRSLMAMHERSATNSRLRRRRGIKRHTVSTTASTMKASKRVVRMEKDTMTVAELAAQLSVKATDIIRKLMELGTMATVNQSLDLDTVTLIAQQYEFTVNDQSFDEDEFFEEEEAEDSELLQARPPVVTVMGHVDHGKTSLLDAIRKADVASGEAGGITQHIGAYQVETAKGKITFLDTPGHEAFTSMRARGAEVTDLVILVVAADDGPMPQTVEAIKHAQAAKVPIIVAINKIDKPGAKPDQIMQSLTEYQLVPEEWGGDTIYVKTSAVKKTGIDELLENVLLQAEVLELSANPDKRAIGTVIEARLDKGFGPRTTIIVQEGTLRVGDAVVVGDSYGKVRALMNSNGEQIEEAPPSTPVELIGLNEVPGSGDQLNAVEDIDAAKEVAAHRGELNKQAEQAKKAPKASLEDLYAKLKGGDKAKEFKIVVKADVQGSVEALSQAFRKLSTSEVTLTIVHAAVGAVTESDVMLASTSEAVIIAFNVKADSKAKQAAEAEGVEIKSYDIIYNALDDVKLAMGGLLTPTTKEQVIGRAEVRQVFNTPKLGVIAGSSVTDGKIARSARVRVSRGGKQVFDGKVGGLKRFKDDVREVVSGFECGISVDGFTDVQVGDIIEAYEVQTIARTLDTPAPASTRPAGRGTSSNQPSPT